VVQSYHFLVGFVDFRVHTARLILKTLEKGILGVDLALQTQSETFQPPQAAPHHV